MTGGLPEKFAANFVDEIMEDHEKRVKRSIVPSGTQSQNRLGNV
jgi:hypothetical protein